MRSCCGWIPVPDAGSTVAQRVSVGGPHWDWHDWGLDAESWLSARKVVEALHESGGFCAIVRGQATEAEVYLVGDGIGVWLLRWGSGPDPLILGAELRGQLAPEIVRVEVEFREEAIEDPPPVWFQLPLELRLAAPAAFDLAGRVIAGEEDLVATQFKVRP